MPLFVSVARKMSVLCLGYPVGSVEDPSLNKSLLLLPSCSLKKNVGGGHHPIFVRVISTNIPQGINIDRNGRNFHLQKDRYSVTLSGCYGSVS